MNKKRLVKFRRKMKVPVVVFGSDIRYLTGVGGIGGPLLVTKDAEFLISSDIELASTANVSNVIKAKKRSAEELFNIMKQEKIKKIGLNLNTLPYNAYKKLSTKVKIVDTSDILKEMREVKDEEEIKLVKKSCKVADNAMALARSSIKKGITEQELNSRILKFNSECESSSFDFVIATGTNSVYTHPVTTSRRIKEKDFVIVDIGFKYEGYCSDITRTFCLKPSKEQLNFHSIVLDAHELALKNIKKGSSCKKPCTVVEKLFKKNKVRQLWKYGLGHGIGLDIHESPSLSLNSKDKFKEGMTFTVEPGLHMLGFGGTRVEDDYLIKGNKPTILTKSPRGLKV